MLQMITNRSPSPAPLRGFPLPLWRGVNGIANNELITVSQTIVGRWPPCPVLQQEARVFTPLSDGEGLGVGLLGGAGVGLLYIYAILRAFSETHQITV